MQLIPGTEYLHVSLVLLLAFGKGFRDTGRLIIVLKDGSVGKLEERYENTQSEYWSSWFLIAVVAL